MRWVKNLSLVVLVAVAFVALGCGSTDSGAMKRSLYVAQHPDLPELVADAIMNGQIMVGMSQEMVQAAWGKPARVETPNAADTPTQWVYGNYFVGGNITNLYFDPTGLLVKYEVNHEPAHANGGTVSTPGETTQGLLSGSDVLLSKESGGQERP